MLVGEDFNRAGKVALNSYTEGPSRLFFVVSEGVGESVSDAIEVGFDSLVELLELIVEKLTFDFTTPGGGPAAVKGRVSDRLVINNVRVEGERDSPNVRAHGTIIPAVTS